MTDMIKLLSNNIASCLKTRDKEYKEFRKYHRYLIETIPHNVRKEFDRVNGIAKNNQGYGLELSISDYKWWSMVLKNEKPKLISLNKLKQKVEDRLMKIYDKSEYKEKENVKNIKEILDIFDKEIEED